MGLPMRLASAVSLGNVPSAGGGSVTELSSDSDDFNPSANAVFVFARLRRSISCSCCSKSMLRLANHPALVVSTTCCGMGSRRGIDREFGRMVSSAFRAGLAFTRAGAFLPGFDCPLPKLVDGGEGFMGLPAGCPGLMPKLVSFRPPGAGPRTSTMSSSNPRR